jgi:XRE family transcriptional regulator, regulator of sulfur utilization
MARRHEPQEALGQAIRRLRDNRGMRQQDLAREAKLSKTHVWRIEQGDVNPGWDTVRELAGALGIKVSELAAVAEELDRETR